MSVVAMEWTNFPCTLCKAGVWAMGTKRGWGPEKIASGRPSSQWLLVNPAWLVSFFRLYLQGKPFLQRTGNGKGNPNEYFGQNGAQNSGILWGITLQRKGPSKVIGQSRTGTASDINSRGHWRGKGGYWLLLLQLQVGWWLLILVQ